VTDSRVTFGPIRAGDALAMLSREGRRLAMMGWYSGTGWGAWVLMAVMMIVAAALLVCGGILLWEMLRPRQRTPVSVPRAEIRRTAPVAADDELHREARKS
jgi:hypothetical protein